MTLNLPTLPMVVSFGRHVVSYAMGAISFAALLHIINPSDASNAAHAINQISDGVAQIAAGISTLVAIGSGVWAAWRVSPMSQLLATASNPEVHEVIVNSPALENAADHNKVVTK